MKKDTKNIEIGDTVKVMSGTKVGSEICELIPVGTVCRVVSVDYEDDGSAYYGIVEVNSKFGLYDDVAYYLPAELQKGSLKWIPDEG